MKTYGIPTFGKKQTNVLVMLDKIKLLNILKAKQYNDILTDKALVSMVYVKTFYPLARLLTYMFATCKIGDDICRSNLKKFEALGEKNPDVKHLLLYMRTKGKVFEDPN